MFLRRTLLVVPALSMLLPVGSALGRATVEEDGGSAPDTYQGEVIFVEDTMPDIPSSNTVITKLPLSRRQTPASVSVVDAERIRKQNGHVLGDALESVSGVNVQTGNGVFDFFVIRGLDSVSSGLVLTDGTAEPEASFYQLYNVERVEVLKGPSAFLYGPSPLAGTVNLVRKQPTAGQFGRASVNFGSFGTVEAAVDANHSTADGAWAYRLNALLRDSDGYRDDKENRNIAVNPAVTWRPNETSSLNVNVEYIDAEYKSDAGLPIDGELNIPDVPRERSYQSPFDTSEQEVLRVQLDFETHVGDSLIVRDKLFFRQLDWLSRGTIFNGVGALPPEFGGTGRPELFRSLLDLDDRQQFIGNQAEVLVRFDTGSLAHHLLTGVELIRQSDEFTFGVGVLPSIDVADPVETAMEPIFFLPTQAFAADTRTTIASVYLVDQIAIGSKWSVTLGGRLDSLNFHDDLSDFERDDDEFSPMAGILFSATDDFTIYANASEAFAPPSTFAREADRVPEKSRQFELGGKSNLLDGRGQATIAYYFIERDDMAIPDETGITQQTGSLESQGLEVELSIEAMKSLHISLAYAKNDAELTEFRETIMIPCTVAGVDCITTPFVNVVVDRTGNRPAFAPTDIANLWVTRSFEGGFELGAGARWVSDQYIAEDNRFEIDGYVTLDAALLYTRGPWRFNVNVDNLTDTEYMTRGFGSTSVIPAPGVAATAGVRYDF